MRTDRVLLVSLFSLAALGACHDPGDHGDPDPDMAAPQQDMTRPPSPDMTGPSPDLSGAGDMAKPADDMNKPPEDMAKPADDMAKPADDMAKPPVDMAMAGPKLTGLPTCTGTGVTADTLFTSVAMASCASGRCHTTGAGGLTFTSGTTLASATVGKASRQTMTIPLVRAGDLDGSYLLYKLMGQQTTPGGSGDPMPKSASRLPDADLCKFIIWIREGAH